MAKTKWRTLRTIVSIRVDDASITEKDLTRAVTNALSETPLTLYSRPAAKIHGKGFRANVVGYGHSQANAARHSPSRISRLSTRAGSLARDLSKLNADLASKSEEI